MRPNPARAPLELKLPVAVAAVLLSVLLTVSWLAYHAFANTAIESAGARLQTLTQQFAPALRAQAERSVEALQATAAEPALAAYLTGRGDQAAARAALDTTPPRPFLARELRDADGARVLVATADTAFLQSEHHVLPMTARDASGSVGPFNAIGGHVAWPVIVPVWSDTVVGHVVEWRALSASSAERDAVSRVLGSGAVIYVGSLGGAWTDQTRLARPPPADRNSVTAVHHYDREGEGAKLGSGAPVTGTSWIAWVEFDRAAVLAPARAFLRRIALVALFLFVAGLVLTWLLIRRITQPLRLLTSAAEAVSAGDYSNRLGLGGTDELALLGAAFDRMSQSVEDTRAALESKVVELRQTQDRVAQVQRMEAMGKLAGGVAHDFNNLLTVILGEVDLGMQSAKDRPDVEATLTGVRAAGERAAALTRQLLAFSRRQLIEPTVFSLHDVILDMSRMLGRLIGEDIEVTTLLRAEHADIHADRGQMEQVILNLAVNARDAMPGGGKLVITTEVVTLDEEYASSRPDASAGDFVMLSMSDTGIGMDEEVKRRIFEPFFTTKDRGSGTGLGLATCYGIVKQAGGHIHVYSERGVGTTMRVYLPCTGEAATVSEKRAPRIPVATGTILLVEDESNVRHVAARMLSSAGYRVMEAANAEEALDILVRDSEQIDLLLTDVVLPGLGGRELAERAVTLRPNLRVLFASGYTDDVILRRKLLSHDATILQKPFTIGSLRLKVHEVLEGVPASAAERDGP